MKATRTQPLNDCIVNMEVLKLWIVSQGVDRFHHFVRQVADGFRTGSAAVVHVLPPIK